MRPIIGRLLLAIGLVHAATVFVFYSDAVSAIVDDGVFDAVPDSSGDADAAFWYLFAGFILFAYAVLVHRIEVRRGSPGAAVGWPLVALGVIGAVLKPTSPFWLFIGIGAVALNRTRRGRQPGRPIVSMLLGALAVMHTVAVFEFYGDGVGDIISAGFIDSVSPSTDNRDAAFWYLLAGVASLVAAPVIHRVESIDHHPPAMIGWSLVTIGAFGALVQPASPIWVVVALGIFAVVRSRNVPRPINDQAVAAEHPVVDSLDFDTLENQIRI